MLYQLCQQLLRGQTPPRSELASLDALELYALATYAHVNTWDTACARALSCLPDPERERLRGAFQCTPQTDSRALLPIVLEEGPMRHIPGAVSLPHPDHCDPEEHESLRELLRTIGREYPVAPWYPLSLVYGRRWRWCGRQSGLAIPEEMLRVEDLSSISRLYVAEHGQISGTDQLIAHSPATGVREHDGKPLVQYHLGYRYLWYPDRMAQIEETRMDHPAAVRLRARARAELWRRPTPARRERRQKAAGRR